MPYVLDLLAEFTLDAWLLARVGADPSGALVDGRVSDTVRAFCIQLGLILCDPIRLSATPSAIRTVARISLQRRPNT